MTCNPKMNYILFSAMESGVFHSSVVRRGSGSSGWAVLFLANDFNTPGKRAIPFPFQNYKKLMRKDC